MAQNTKISLIISKVSVYFLMGSNFVKSQLVNIFNFAGQATYVADLPLLLVSHPHSGEEPGVCAPVTLHFYKHSELDVACRLKFVNHWFSCLFWKMDVSFKVLNRCRDSFLCVKNTS